MGRLVVVENVSLDGVMQGPASADEDTRDGFTHGGWANELLSADPDAAMAAFGRQTSTVAMLFGRRTYFDVVGHWLSVDTANPFTDSLRVADKYVASRNTELDLPYPNSRLVDGSLVDGVRSLVQRVDGDVVVLGSGDVVRQLAAAGLVDRYVLTVLPVVLGSGTRLFGDVRQDLTVASSTTSATGIVTSVFDVR